MKSAVERVGANFRPRIRDAGTWVLHVMGRAPATDLSPIKRDEAKCQDFAEEATDGSDQRPE